MPNSPYLRPLGLLYGSAAIAATQAGAAAPLAGGPVAFSLVEVIEGAPGRTKRRIAPYADLAASGEAAIRQTLERITARRAPLAGLAFDRPVVMGVVNVTPDSFSDGGLYDTTEAAIVHAAALAQAGAAILDVGGESTRPGAEPVDAMREAERILPVIEGLRGVRAVLSADTRKASVMERAVKAGARILNDVSALTYDPESQEVAARSGAAVVLMHAKGDPRTMQENPSYADVALEVFDYLNSRIEACEEAGISRNRIIADPGIGFGKTHTHNLELLASIGLFHGLGVPLLVGASRKSFIGALMREAEPGRRVSGSVAAALAAAAQGVQILRVHDVRDTVGALAVWRAATTGTQEEPLAGG